jgi:D-alanyl-D-alanine carboxypeptidase (penicillin-binding protein 5/6)
MVTVSESVACGRLSNVHRAEKAVSVDELLRGEIVQSATMPRPRSPKPSPAPNRHSSTHERRARLGIATAFRQRDRTQRAATGIDRGRLARIATAIIRDFRIPAVLDQGYRYNNITQSNRNRLLWSDPYVDGMKTGLPTPPATASSPRQRGPRRLLSVVLGAGSEASRASESQKLLNYGFQFYDTVQLYQNGQSVPPAIRVWKGTEDSVFAGFIADRYVTLPKGQAPKLKLTRETNEPIVAPVARGQRVGVVKVTLEDKPVGEFALVALSDVPPASFFGRMWDTVRLWFK